MFVYKITNIKNGKMYIGQTINSIESRFKRHINDAMNNILDTHFARAIRKYGPDSFVIEILDFAYSQEELTYKEYFWINYFKSNIVGYNETCNMYKCGGNTYYNKSDEDMKIISNKIRNTKIWKNNPNSKIVKCLNVKTLEELFFYTVDDCRKYFIEKNHRFITTRVSRQTKSLYKNEWAIAYYEDDYFQENTYVNHTNGYNISIVDLHLFKEYIFYSINDAIKSTNIPKKIFKDAISNSPIFYNNMRIIVYKN